MTPEELALLTPEEREGFEDGGDDEPELDDDGNPINADDDNGDDQNDGADDDAAADDANTEQPGRDDGAAAAQALLDAAKGEQEVEPPRAQPVPLIRAEVPADIEDKRADVEKRRDAIAQEFEDGDKTAREFQAANRLLDKEENELDWLVRKADLSVETTKAQAEASWYKSTEAFLADHPEIMKNELVYNAFDAVVRQVTADKANHGLSDHKQLEKAHAIWAESLGIKVEAAPAPKGKTDPKAPAKPKRDLPPILAGVPAATASETDDGKYAALDRLMETDPLAYEAALAKMSPTESDAYLASQ